MSENAMPDDARAFFYEKIASMQSDYDKLKDTADAQIAERESELLHMRSKNELAQAKADKLQEELQKATGLLEQKNREVEQQHLTLEVTKHRLAEALFLNEVLQSDLEKSYTKNNAAMQKAKDDYQESVKCIEELSAQIDAASNSAQEALSQKEAEIQGMDADLQKATDAIHQMEMQLWDNVRSSERLKLTAILLSASLGAFLILLITFSVQKGLLRKDIYGLEKKIEEQYALHQEEISEMKAQTENQGKEITKLKQENSKLDTRVQYLNDYADATPGEIAVKVTSVFDGYINPDDDQIEKYSDILIAERLRYLCLEYNIYAPRGIDKYLGKDLFLRIYKPGGNMIPYLYSSFNRYTTTKEITGKSGVIGHDNDMGDFNTPGQYRIEFVYNSIVVGTTTVELQ